MSPFIGIPENETEEEKAERWQKDRRLWAWYAKTNWLYCPICDRWVSEHDYPELKVCFEKAVKLKYFNG